MNNLKAKKMAKKHGLIEVAAVAFGLFGGSVNALARRERTMKTTHSTLALVLAAGLSIVGPAHGAAFQNGSFELASVDPGASFTTLGAGSTAITGWTVGGDGIDYIGGYWDAADGSRSLDMSSTGAGSIFQDFDTVVGAFYDVQFALAGNPDGGPIEKFLSLDVLDSAANYVFQSSITFDTSGQTKTDMGWINPSFSFQATTATTRILFTSENDTAYGPALDNVRITQRTDGQIPLPTPLALIGLGLAAIGVTRRKRLS
jgi:choice-of-anchor C domain-containing protein